MAKYQYKIVPFVPTVKVGVFSQEGATSVAQQLQAIIDKYAEAGWEFYSFGDVDVTHTPGCLASMMGSRSASIPYDLLVFRAEA